MHATSKGIAGFTKCVLLTAINKLVVLCIHMHDSYIERPLHVFCTNPTVKVVVYIANRTYSFSSDAFNRMSNAFTLR